MELDDNRLPPGPSAGPSTSVSRRFSTSTSRSGTRTLSRAESRQSDETAPISDSAFQTPDPGVSELSLPPLSPTSADARGDVNSRQPEHLRDSGIDTSNASNHEASNGLTQSLPNLPPLMPAVEDRPDLWRHDAEPPTFRPRTEGDDPNATQGLAAIGDLVGARLDDDTQNRPQPRPRGIRRVLAFLGYGTGNTYRKELVGVVWSLGFGFVQVALALVFIIYSSVHRSPRQPQVSEWTACDRPLGIWACFWIFKVIMDCAITYWGFRRDWKGGQLRPVDVEEGAASQPDPDARPSPVDTNPHPSVQGSEERQRRRTHLNSNYNRLYHRLNFLLSLVIISWFLTANIFVFNSLHTCRRDAPHLWWLNFSFLCLQYITLLEMVLTVVIVFIIGPLIFLIWSIVLICLGRHPIQNPHYINPDIGKVSKSAVEQIPLVLYIPTPPGEDEKIDGINPSHPTTVSKHEKPSKAGAEHTYPPKQPPRRRRFAFLLRKSPKPSSGSGDAEKTGSREKSLGTWEDCWESGEFPFVRLDPNRASCAICLLDFEEPKRRVAREVIKSWAQKNKQGSSEIVADPVNSGKRGDGGAEKRDKKDKQVQAPSVPDVDVDTSERAGPSYLSSDQTPPSPDHPPDAQREESIPRRSSSDTHPVAPDSRDDHSEDDDEDHSMRLEDAGEGAQPLRLLPCGHAFHKTCIDPWLTGVSGRCPTCQRPVLPSDPPSKKRSRNRDRGGDRDRNRERDQNGPPLP